jgi:hypothetical protein
VVVYGQSATAGAIPQVIITILFSGSYRNEAFGKALAFSLGGSREGMEMLSFNRKTLPGAIAYGISSLFVMTALALGQDGAPGWHRFGTPVAPSPVAPSAVAPQMAPREAPERITIPAGTFVTVRVDQLLSSDKNRPGDGFSATLARPIVADGLVVARRGETLGGNVVDAKKAGRVKGVSHLQIELSSLTLADGHQVEIRTELTSITGTTSKERDAGAIAATTVTGAAIGGAAAWGPGAAIGGGAGLVAGAVGVLVTRGHPTIVYPESQLTFRLADPVTFSTARAPQAFVDASTLNTQRATAAAPALTPRPPAYQGCAGPGCYPPPYSYGPYYPYPYYWTPSVGFYFGPGFYGHGYYPWRYRR